MRSHPVCSVRRRRLSPVVARGGRAPRFGGASFRMLRTSPAFLGSAAPCWEVALLLVASPGQRSTTFVAHAGGGAGTPPRPQSMRLPRRPSVVGAVVPTPLAWEFGGNRGRAESCGLGNHPHWCLVPGEGLAPRRPMPSPLWRLCCRGAGGWLSSPRSPTLLEDGPSLSPLCHAFCVACFLGKDWGAASPHLSPGGSPREAPSQHGALVLAPGSFGVASVQLLFGAAVCLRGGTPPFSGAWGPWWQSPGGEAFFLRSDGTV